MSNHRELDPDLRALRDSLVAFHTERLFEEQERRGRQPGSGDGLRLARVIVGMAGGALDRSDRAILEKIANLAGADFDAHRIVLPWELLRRDLTVANAGQAGYLVATSVGAVADVLRGWSVSVSAGITLLDGLTGNLTVPRVTTAPSAVALPTEGTTITPTTPTLAQVALVPKNLACFVQFSRQLLVQANADSFVRMILLGALGQFLDRQILQGSGAAGEMTGLFNVAGVQTQSGTTLSHNGTTTMKKLAAEAGARDEEIAFVSTPAVRQLLENRERATGNGGFVWGAGSVGDRPAFASNDCPSASMISGPWPRVVVGQWGPPGVTLEINPFDSAGFKAGVIQGRMILSADMGVIAPGAFVKSTSIT